MSDVRLLFLQFAVFLTSVASLEEKTVAWNQKRNQCPKTHFLKGIGSESYNYDWKKVVCSPITDTWQNQPQIVEYIRWTTPIQFDQVWASCPQGYFLNGILFSTNSAAVKDMTDGKCIKPAKHPRFYKSCYDHDVTYCDDLDTAHASAKCACDDTYYVTAIYRYYCRIGNSTSNRCISKLRCCMMADKQDIPNEKLKVQDLIMDQTITDLAKLGRYLGFFGARSCRSTEYGEDFKQDGNKWKAAPLTLCGATDKVLLEIEYNFHQFKVLTMDYGDWTPSNVEVDIVDSGVLQNNNAHPAKKEVSRTESIAQTVSHTVATDWAMAHELEFSIEYTSPGESITAGATYGFSYENSESIEDSSETTHERPFTITASKTIGPYSASGYEAVLKKMHNSMSYVANVELQVSVKLTGKLSWLIYNSTYPNFHRDYRGKVQDYNRSPVFSYTFGNESVPFWEALKLESEGTVDSVWMWEDMFHLLPEAHEVINRLETGTRYQFQLRGTFQEIASVETDMTWSDATFRNSSTKRAVGDQRRFAKLHVAKRNENNGELPRPVWLESPDGH